MFQPLKSSKRRNAGLGAVALIVLLSGCGSLPTSPVEDPSSSQRSVGPSSVVMDGGADDANLGAGGPVAPAVTDPGLPINEFNNPPLVQQRGHAYGHSKKHRS